MVVKVLLIAYVLIGNTAYCVSAMRTYGDHAARPALYGIYNVETYVRNNDTIPPLLTDTTRWRQLIIGGWQQYPFVFVKGMNDSLHRYTLRADTASQTVVLFPRTDTTRKSFLTWQFPDPQHFILKGRCLGDSIYVRMKVYDLRNFELTSRGFHWINEYPHNR